VAAIALRRGIRKAVEVTKPEADYIKSKKARAFPPH